MNRAKFISLFLVFLLMNNHPIRGNDFLDSIELFVFSDPDGLWINRKNGAPELIYQLPPSWKIESITIDEISNSIYFTEVCRFGYDHWLYSNVRAIPIERTFIVDTIASTAGRSSPGSFSMLGKHYPSPNGNYLILERGGWEGASLDLYEKTDRNWVRLKVPTESDYQRFLGWSKDSKHVYLSRSNTGTIEGMFCLNIESFEVQKVNEFHVRTMDPERNIFLRIPHEFRSNRPYTLEFREVESGNIIKSVEYQFRGSPLWGQIQWHSSLPMVLIPERSTDGRKPNEMFISTISPVDSLNSSTVLPGRITQFQWMNKANSFLYVFEGYLCLYSFESEEFERIWRLRSRENIQTFALKWIE